MRMNEIGSGSNASDSNVVRRLAAIFFMIGLFCLSPGFFLSPGFSALAEDAAPGKAPTGPAVSVPAQASPAPADSTPKNPSSPSAPSATPVPEKPAEIAPPPPAGTAPVPVPNTAEPDTKNGAGVPGIPGDATTQMLDIPARPTAVLHGKADWETGFKSIQASLETIKAEIAKAGLKQGGKPIAVFTETGDQGFTYDAMIPLAEKPSAPVTLGQNVKLGVSPSGKAIKFQHRGAYDDIDSTYDLITAYLDEKGLEAQNLFIEEYLSDTKNSDDQGLEVDIYVFIKTEGSL